MLCAPNLRCQSTGRVGTSLRKAARRNRLFLENMGVYGRPVLLVNRNHNRNAIAPLSIQFSHKDRIVTHAASRHALVLTRTAPPKKGAPIWAENARMISKKEFPAVGMFQSISHPHPRICISGGRLQITGEAAGWLTNVTRTSCLAKPLRSSRRRRMGRCDPGHRSRRLRWSKGRARTP